MDAIVGNPPFLGDKKMRGELGNDYTDSLRKLYEGRVPGGADLVTYWFEKARAHIEQGKAKYAGLVATNSIRGGANRKVLERIAETGTIFNTWSDEEWVNNGAAVRVSLVCFAGAHGAPYLLDDQPVASIHADLTAGGTTGGMDLTHAKPLNENTGVAFIGTQKTGQFDIPGELARQWLKLPNPNGCSNSEVVRPWANGMDISRRPSDTWIIDFGVGMPENEAALYEEPFRFLQENVRTSRDGKREVIASRWWLHTRPRPDMRRAMTGLSRYIATPRVAKHRLFVWLAVVVLPDSRLTIIARSDDTTFGVLHSRFHESWTLATCSWHGVGNDPTYNAQSVFETFPFPVGLTPDLPSPPAPQPPAGEGSLSPSPVYGRGVGERERISAAAQKLNQLRENWLNPPEWVERVPEVVAGYPDRIIARPEHAAELKKRTLTNLYNARPAWLDNAHKELDMAVAAAYGWDDYTPEMPDEEILRRLLALNLDRNRG